MNADNVKLLYEVMRRTIANHGTDSRKAAFDEFVAILRDKPTSAIALAEYYFEREFPKWAVDSSGNGSTVVVPPEVRAAERIVRKADVEQEAVRIARRVRNMVLMDLVLPTGKKLRESTFADCAKAGGWFSEIAKHGKPNQAVDKKLTEDDLQNIWTRFQKAA
jgi:hypothetical protein